MPRKGLNMPCGCTGTGPGMGKPCRRAANCIGVHGAYGVQANGFDIFVRTSESHTLLGVFDLYWTLLGVQPYLTSIGPCWEYSRI